METQKISDAPCVERKPRMVFAEGITLIDFQLPVTGLSEMNGHTLEQIRTRYPAAESITAVEYMHRKEAMLMKDPPCEITREQWTYALEVLPPQNWQAVARKGMSFEMCEHTSGRITAIYLRKGGKHYTWLGIAGSSHDEKLAEFERRSKL